VSRDAWQGLPAQIPAVVKTEYLGRLVAAGFKHIDAVSFVSPAAVPQMADSEQVLECLTPSRDVEIIGIVVNERGAERAIDTGRCRRWASHIRSRPSFFNAIRSKRQSNRWMHSMR